MNIHLIHRVYFIGAGGIGMSALARFFLAMGKKLAGYDRVRTSLTDKLSEEGVEMHYMDGPEYIPEEFKNPSGRKDSLVVYTPAIPENHKELNYFTSNGFKLRKRAEVLGMISASYSSIAIAGTHGKTSVSTMISHLFFQGFNNCLAFLGGLAKNYHSNLLLSEKIEYLVAEADEFDRSFLHLHPKYAVITSMDADHLDIYKSHAHLKEAFCEFIDRIEQGGFLVYKKGLDIQKTNQNIAYFTYSLHEKADFYAENLRLENHQYVFDFVHGKQRIEGIRTPLIGEINIENAVAAISVAYKLGMDIETIRKVFKTFIGVQRRLDLRFKSKKLIYIDDYAHHPEEIKQLIRSVRSMYPGKKIHGIFQPHLYSRTRDFAMGFAESLSALDGLYLLDIYPAREEPIKGVDAGLIFREVSIAEKEQVDFETVLHRVNHLNDAILLTIGAGDIGTLADYIVDILKSKYFECDD